MRLKMSIRLGRVIVAGALAGGAVGVVTTLGEITPAGGAPGDTVRVSVSTSGTEGNNLSADPSLSADGRYVVFRSYASTLVPDDSNGQADVFVRDRSTDTTKRVSVANDGSQGNGASHTAPLRAVSADGRSVVFMSNASNLVAGDTNNGFDVFVRDLVAGTTERVSVASDGTQANGISYSATISADGRYLAFESQASNLVPGDTNNAPDAFVRDRQAGTTERVSVSNTGQQSVGDLSSLRPAISADGRYVAFNSYADNLVPNDPDNGFDLFVRDRVASTTELINPPGGVEANSEPTMSDDGRYLVYSTIRAGTESLFLHDRQTGLEQQVNVRPDGSPGLGEARTPLSAPTAVTWFSAPPKGIW